MTVLRAPFPYFGGKSKVARIVWEAFGPIRNYVEPFFGSGAVLLARPDGFAGPETINDFDGFLSNFWRAIQHDPEAVADFADWPVNENDLHARHAWLVSRRGELTAALEGDPDYFDAKMAGWWVWGLCSWIGSGWCSGEGPWIVEDGKLVDSRQRPHLGDAGQGINRKLHGDRHDAIFSDFQHLSNRLRDVRVCCGDWFRVMGESVTVKHPGITGVFLDPPYADTAGRDTSLYACDSLTVAHDVREWCLANGDNPRLRIALCGYEGEHAMPESWTCIPWKAHGGFGNQGQAAGRENAHKERIWFSPACLFSETHQPLFEEAI